MKSDIIVFQEQRFHFGINPDEFEDNFSLNSAWISPSEISTKLWRFERKNPPEKGYFLHFGALLDLTSVYFNNGSQIFMKRTPERQLIGICISSAIFQISLKKNNQKIIEIDEFDHIPADLPKTIFNHILRYQQKNIFIVDPLLLFRAYQLLY